MDYYRSTFSSIVWMDSFLFFYWDIRRYRGADAENIDRLIIDFFQRKVPNITSSQDPTPWDTLLCQLMRSLACLLGSRTDPEQPHRRHDWLLREVGEPQRSGSYVDWLALEPIIYRQRPPHPGEQVSALMSYMNTAYEHDRKDPFQWLNTWKGNPFLNEFGHAHQSRYWTMPLPVHVDRLLTIAWKYQSESFMCNRGSNISPAATHNYSIWLDSISLTSSPAKPHVDWFNIEKYYDSHEAETATQDVLAILEEMDAAAHRDGPKVNCSKPISV
ncbi:hypothetical protein GQ607_004417 [Colletotrichum asianum]|uniref:Uncharacterized protein n=1 Tax=Colletotrichum asianum TaxID=702518 RepID=A0A8H3WKP0_9PEZI|nr:hypothetical protein GQ607_004417 [Colletotrichum asianum]